MKTGSVVVVNPEIMSGEPCFAGTRVPVRALFDYIEGGETLGGFLGPYPTVSRAQAIGFLEEATESLLATAYYPDSGIDDNNWWRILAVGKA